MPRSTMASLISQVRDIINDPAGASQIFTDDQIQLVLDRDCREDVYQEEMVAVVTYQANPFTSVWLNYWAPRGLESWESDETIYSPQWTTLTPATSDRDLGHWTFSSSQYPPCFITGKSFDLWRAAYTLKVQQANSFATAMSFSADRQSFNPGETYDRMMAQAQAFKRRARIRTATLVRSDVMSGEGGY